MRLINILSIATCLLIVSCNKEAATISPDGSAIKTAADTSHKIVVILGSSTAFGTGATPIDSSWVNLLNYKFKADKKNISILNLALGGYTTYHIMPSNVTIPNGRPGGDVNRNLDKALSFKPDLIIINLPSNDITNGFADKEIIDNYKVICNEIKRNNIEFIVTSTQPRNFPEVQARERLLTFNGVLKTLLPSNTIDFYNLLADQSLRIKSELDFGDGIHLNNKGHKIIFEELLKDKRMRLVLGY
ncbi:MAG TPA: SGNH/GDSL hydrolase family protein [Segetibacter sp.]|jgi:lysophospholipase L1-like esterase